MALKVELKPGERFILGGSVITNDKQRTKLFIEGTTPILREKDILLPENARTPCERIYLAVQTMYLSERPAEHHDFYFSLVKDVLRAAPSTLPYIEAVNNEILTGSLYKALKKTQALIAYERELLEHAKRGTDVREDGQDHGK